MLGGYPRGRPHPWLGVWAGLHAGEYKLIGNELVGLAIHIGARVAAKAGASEVLVSSTVKELVSNSGFRFRDRGVHTLKGVSGTGVCTRSSINPGLSVATRKCWRWEKARVG